MRERRLPDSAYRLKRAQGDTTFYLVGGTLPDSGQGVARGNVARIGWRKGFILAFCHTGNGPNYDGWMVIDSHADTLGGPYTDFPLTMMPSVAGIATLPAQEAWDSLGKL